MKAVSEPYHVYFDADINAVVMAWNGYPNSSQFKEGTELMLNTLIRHRSDKVLADIKDMALIGMEDQRWLDTQFIPRAIRFGFKAIAIVKPDSYFNRVAVETISDKIDDSQLALRLFDSVTEATDWLKTMPFLS